MTYYARVVFETNASAAQRHDDVSEARRWIDDEHAGTASECHTVRGRGRHRVRIGRYGAKRTFKPRELRHHPPARGCGQ